MSTSRRIRPRRKLDGYSPGLEMLEGRQLLDCAIASNGRTLAITGDEGPNVVEITDDGTGRVQATCDGLTKHATRVSRIVVKTSGGDDVVRYRLEGDLSRRVNLVFDQGEGNDSLSGEATGVAIRRGASIVASAKGGGGDDTIEALFEGVLDGTIRLLLDGGTGDDELFVSATIDEDDFSAAGFAGATLRGGPGDDVLTDEAIDESFGGAVGRALLDGGPGFDDCSAPVGAAVRGCEDEAFDSLAADAIPEASLVTQNSIGQCFDASRREYQDCNAAHVLATVSARASRANTRLDDPWGGRTAQGRPLQFNVQNGRLTFLSFQTNLSGTTCSVTLGNRIVGGSSQGIRRNSFSFSHDGGVTGTSFVMQGRFRRRSEASGTLSVWYPPCGASLNTTWTASRFWGEPLWR